MTDEAMGTHFSLMQIIWTYLLIGATSASLAAPTVRQITFGPANHFFGYIGHVGNTPWNGSDRYMVLLRTTFQKRMPTAADIAEIVILDAAKDYALEEVDETRAWNPQQGTMLYWNPERQETQFFFNDRDPKTQKVFCVLYDLETRQRLKEFRFPDTPIGNSGVAQQGGYYLGLNYGRMDRLRRVTGYANAFDWTRDELAPVDDGVFKVDVESGQKTLLVSFARLAHDLREQVPGVKSAALFINHTLWSRDDQRILFYLRGNWNLRGPRINEFFTVHADGSHLTRHEVFPGGHPEWGQGHTVIGSVEGKQVLYDVDTRKITGHLGTSEIFPDPEGDIALSMDGLWFVNGYKRYSENKYVVYNMQTGLHFSTPGIERGPYLSGNIRLDPSPCWRHDAKAIAVPGIAEDGSRQTFIITF